MTRILPSRTALLVLLVLHLCTDPGLCREAPSLSTSHPAPVFHAATFGAVADDGADDTAAIQAAIDAAIRAGPHTSVQLDVGQLDLNDTLHIRHARDLTFTGVSASATLLLVHARSGVLNYENCTRLTLSSLSIDFAPDFIPFTAGHVTNHSTSRSPPYTLDVAVAPPHTTRAGMRVAAVHRYDEKYARPAFGPDAYEFFQQPSDNDTSVVLSDGVVRFRLVRQPERTFEMGQAVVLRYEAGPHAIGGMDSYDVTLSDMVVYASHDMTHASNRVHNMRVVDYHVRPGAGRWLSSWADCMHFGDHRGHIAIINSSCSSMGDDGLNVHSYLFNVTTLVSATTAVVSLIDGGTWLDTLNVGVGTSLSFACAATPYKPHAQYEVAALHQHSPTSYLFTFTSPIPTVALYDWAWVADAPSLLLSNFTVANNRARGVLLETHNVTIERCLFDHTSGPALLFQPSAYWGEAEEGENVTVRESVFDGCNQGIAQQLGVVAILPDPVQLAGVVNDVLVERCTFLQGEHSLRLLQDWNGDGVELRDNWISRLNSSTTPLPPVSVCNSQRLRVRHNRARWGSRALYELDESGVCNSSLSSELHFSADAFNATFEPHVMPAPSGYGVVVLGSDNAEGGAKARQHRVPKRDVAVS